jgi:hypothetical protein
LQWLFYANFLLSHWCRRQLKLTYRDATGQAQADLGLSRFVPEYVEL